MDSNELLSAVLALNSKNAFKFFSREKVYMLSENISPFDAVKAEKVKDAVIALYPKDSVQSYLNKSVKLAEKTYVGIFVDTNKKIWVYASPEEVTQEIVDVSNKMRANRSVQIAERIAQKEAKAQTSPAPAFATSRNLRTGLSLG